MKRDYLKISPQETLIFIGSAITLRQFDGLSALLDFIEANQIVFGSLVLSWVRFVISIAARISEYSDTPADQPRLISKLIMAILSDLGQVALASVTLVQQIV